ncbi:MAG TPA: hypothetical protein VLX30_14700 [Burkholderiales bacterium]|nr:hypothetical protein [Burkholderiales bacterium]
MAPRWRLALATAVALGVSACQSGPPAPPDPEPALQALAQSGYVSEPRYGTQALQETWDDGEQQLEVSFIAPAAPGAAEVPLIVYLPGLGESTGSGALWRRTWAQAGYAVLAVQPRRLTQRIWASPMAREGDFEALARNEFSSRAAARRIATLRFALDELARRAQTGNPLYRLADRSTIVLAGFDLGAQTASRAAGARDAAVRAAIIISPYVLRQNPAEAARYAAITLPVLSITGTDDADPFGIVSDPALRRTAWRAMPAGDKYLLLLAGGTHALLAGNGLFDPYSASALAPGSAADGGQKRRRGRQERRGGSDAADELNFSGAGPKPLSIADASGSGEARGRRAGAGASGPRAYNLRQVAAVEDVSTAFLDAFVKKNVRARDWLGRDAARWLGASAALEVK